MTPSSLPLAVILRTQFADNGSIWLHSPHVVGSWKWGSEWGSGNRDEASSRMLGVGVMAPYRGGKTCCKPGSGNQLREANWWRLTNQNQSSDGGLWCQDVKGNIEICSSYQVRYTSHITGIISSIFWQTRIKYPQPAPVIIKYFCWITIICCADHRPSPPSEY